MRKCLCPLFVVFCLATVPAFGFEEGIAYRGRIEAVDANALNEYTPIPMVFRLYASATGGKVLWGRKHSVPLDTNGVFNVVLSDGSGVAVAGAAFDVLADALASTGGGAWIGLTPGNASDDDASLEFSPRQRIVAVPMVQRANVARASENLEVPALVAGTLNVSSNLTVRELDVVGVQRGIALSKLRLVMGVGTLYVEDAVRCRTFSPPMSAPMPVPEPIASQGAEVQCLAIGQNGQDGSNDVKSVYTAFLPVLEKPGRDVSHVQQVGGTTANGGAR